MKTLTSAFLRSANFLGAIFLLSCRVRSQIIRPLVLLDERDSVLTQRLDEAVVDVQRGHADVSVQPEYLLLDSTQTPEDLKSAVCGGIAGSVGARWTVVVDLTWEGVTAPLTEAVSRSALPYVRVEVGDRSALNLTLDYLHYMNATDAALIFNSQREINQSIASLLGNTMLRLVIMEGLSANIVEDLKKVRPSPTYYVIFADTFSSNRILWEAMSLGLITKDSWWTVIISDSKGSMFSRVGLSSSITLAQSIPSTCCSGIPTYVGCVCTNNSTLTGQTARAGFAVVLSSLAEMSSSSVDINPLPLDCSRSDNRAGQLRQQLNDKLSQMTSVETSSVSVVEVVDDSSASSASLLRSRQEFSLDQLNSSRSVRLGRWSASAGLQVDPDYRFSKIKRYFRVGVIEANPWTYRMLTATGEQVRDSAGNPVYTGYCVDLLKRLADMMDFEYDLVFPADGFYGTKHPATGEWNGLVKDLSLRDTDLVVAALTMTSEREEVIDFVAPFFDQSGISIMIRKQDADTSLFRFMSVLRQEVWISVVAALVLTGTMIWMLDRLSPYSAQNNPDLYPYPCRKFTVKESFWFALTSFTPQGGGEAPKALSGRTLVAAYWLFVVLMLATFTANLAAFLTVERLQTTVKDLDHLAKQSKVAYTVTANTSVASYFGNMAHAENTLFKIWKELTLNATADQAKYRVWDYPIKEQYTHIYNSIVRTGMVPNDSVGLQTVMDDTSGTFAFIHDASIVRYEIYNNCNLTQIGEPFAEQPYAIAVQEGSNLREEISRNILDLQKDLYFEMLTARYWNSSLRSSCPSRGDAEGITLHSLGGVFIATLAGLVLALFTLAGEVVYYRTHKSATVEQQPPTKTAISVISILPSNQTDQYLD